MTGRGRIPTDGVCTHKQNNNFVAREPCCIIRVDYTLVSVKKRTYLVVMSSVVTVS